MMIKKFIEEDVVKNFQIEKYIREKLKNIEISNIYIHKNPVNSRVVITVAFRNKLLMRKRLIYNLKRDLEEKFGLENVFIEVRESEEKALDAQLMAVKIAKLLELGRNPRGVLNRVLEEIMSAGAIGAEIVADGKLTGKGGRSRKLRVWAGYVPKVGDVIKNLRYGFYVAYPKPGAIGISVTITPPDFVFPDMIKDEDLNVKLALYKQKLQENEDNKTENTSNKKEENKNIKVNEDGNQKNE